MNAPPDMAKAGVDVHRQITEAGMDRRWNVDNQEAIT